MLICSIGIVCKVFDDEKLVDEAIGLGQEISKYSLLALMAAKEAVLKGKYSSIS